MSNRQAAKQILIIVLLALLFIGLIPGIFAATIHGDVYDLSLDRISDVAVEVNTTPHQRIISQEGSYTFSLPTGSYKITAQQFQNNLIVAKAEELVQVVDEADYVIDLFLYPNLDGEQSILNGTNIPPDKPESPESLFIVLAVILILVVLAGIWLIIVRFRKRKIAEPAKKEQPTEEKSSEENPVESNAIEKTEPLKSKETTFDTDDDLKKLIEILKSEGGRATQKEIRKHIPLSEAKVSLIITELEAKGYIEKIKKGRGNIIILKKKD